MLHKNKKTEWDHKKVCKRVTTFCRVYEWPERGIVYPPLYRKTTMLKEQTSLKVYDLAADKEQWDTIPAVIYASILTLHKNCSNIKRFVESLEGQIKVLTKKHCDLEQRVTTLEGRSDHHDRRSAFLFLHSFNLYARQRNEHLKLQREVNDVQDLQLCCVDEWVKETTGGNVKREHLSIDLIRHISREEHNKNEKKQSYIKELGNRLESCWGLAEENQNRFLSWRQALQETTQTTEELGRELVTVQNQLTHMNETRMEMAPIQQKFDDLAQQHFESIQLVETSILSIEEQQNQSKVDLENQTRQLLDDMETQLVNNNTKMLAALHERLNPMAEYINQLHYKQDAANEMLKNTETTTLPNLESRLSMINTEADKLNQWSADAVSKLNISAKQLQDKTDELTLECGNIRTALREKTQYLETKVINQFRREFHDHVGESCTRLTQLEDNHACLRKTASHLEERVAKWISARPLPVKVSEARLYSMETILHRAMTDRMKWEKDVERKLQQIFGRPPEERELVPVQPPVPPDADPSPRPSPHTSRLCLVADASSKESLLESSRWSAHEPALTPGFNVVQYQRGVSLTSGKASVSLAAKKKVIAGGEKKNLPSLPLSARGEPSETKNAPAKVSAVHSKSLLFALR